MLKKHSLLLSMLKTVLLPNVLWKPWYIFFQDSLANKSSTEPHFFKTEIIWNIKKVFTVITVTFVQFNTTLLNKCINFFEKKQQLTDPKLLSGSVYNNVLKRSGRVLLLKRTGWATPMTSSTGSKPLLYRYRSSFIAATEQNKEY